MVEFINAFDTCLILFDSAVTLEAWVLAPATKDILQEERGFEAPFSLMLTSYSLLVCVNDVSSALRQSISILVSAYGLANFIYIQLDLNLVDEEEIQRAGVLENAVEEVIHASKSC